MYLMIMMMLSIYDRYIVTVELCVSGCHYISVYATFFCDDFVISEIEEPRPTSRIPSIGSENTSKNKIEREDEVDKYVCICWKSV